MTVRLFVYVDALERHFFPSFHELDIKKKIQVTCCRIFRNEQYYIVEFAKEKREILSAILPILPRISLVFGSYLHSSKIQVNSLKDLIKKIDCGVLVKKTGNRIEIFKIHGGNLSSLEKKVKTKWRSEDVETVAFEKFLWEELKKPWDKGRMLAHLGVVYKDPTYLHKALQEWRKVNKPYAKLFSAELYRLLGEFDKAKKLLEQAKKHYRKGKAAYYCKVIEELIKMRTTKFYDVPDIIGETQHKVGDNEWLLISPSGVKLKKIVPKFWRFGKKEVIEKISKEETMRYIDKLDELGKAKLVALEVI